MKNRLMIILAFFSFFSANAQIKKNSFEVGRSFYYFPQSGFDWDVVFNLKLEYTRAIKDSKWKYRLGSEFFLKEYTINRQVVLGDVFDRWFLTFDASGYRTLFEGKKSQFGVYFGVLYRYGSESIVKKIIDKITWTDIITPEISDNSFGLLTSLGYNCNIKSKWIFGSEIGIHKYFQDDGTLIDYFGTLKVGLLF